MVNTAPFLQHPLLGELDYTCLGSAPLGAFGQEQLVYWATISITVSHFYKDTQLTKLRISMETCFWTFEGFQRAY